MKRVFDHPPESRDSGGKHYWRGLGEYSNSPEFRQWLEREFHRVSRSWEATSGRDGIS